MYTKYPRTFHLPWSPGKTSDDKTLKDVSCFEGKDVVVTLKLDGENTTLYSDYMHARSLDYAHHASRSFIRQTHGNIAHKIPEGFRVCGENIYAQHSIPYTNLPRYFFVFSVWDQTNICMSWQDTKVWAKSLGLETVPTLYEGPWNQKLIQNLPVETGPYGNDMEGYVVRNKEAFPYDSFIRNCAKFVRANHVQTDKHWKTQTIIPNKMRK